MKDTEQAKAYLKQDPLRYMDMLQPLERGEAEVVALREDGVLLYEVPGQLYLLAADSLEAGQALCAGIETMRLAATHDQATGEYLCQRYGREKCQPCTQAAYLGRDPFPLPPGLDIRRLGGGIPPRGGGALPRLLRPGLHPPPAGRRGDARGLSKRGAGGLYRHARRGQRGHAGGLSPLPPQGHRRRAHGFPGQLGVGAGLGALLPDLGGERGLFRPPPPPGLEPVPLPHVLGDGLVTLPHAPPPKIPCSVPKWGAVFLYPPFVNKL